MIKQCETYDIFEKDGMKMTVKGPMAGTEWLVEFTIGGRRAYMDIIPSYKGDTAESQKKTAYSMAVRYMQNKAEQAKKELADTEVILQILKEINV